MTEEYKWGDDPGTAIQKAAGTPLAAQVESDVVAGYLLALRSLLEKDAELHQAVAGCHPAQEARPLLIAAHKAVKPGTEHLLERAATILLDELQQMRAASPSLYLVSCKTGRSVMPIAAKDVYTPPDFEGLNGVMQKSRPIVHPGLSSTLALAAHEAAKRDSMMALVTPEAAMAFAHMTEPERMLERAKQKLAGIVEFAPVDGPQQEIEFGREHVAGLEQSANLAFHRVELFASTLAKKILDRCGPGGRCSVGGVRSCSGSKQRWFICTLKFERAAAASSG